MPAGLPMQFFDSAQRVITGGSYEVFLASKNMFKGYITGTSQT